MVDFTQFLLRKVHNFIAKWFDAISGRKSDGGRVIDAFIAYAIVILAGLIGASLLY